MSNHLTSTRAISNRVDFHRDAYNAAFYELGLKWHWEELVYKSMLSDCQEREGLLCYPKTHQTHFLGACQSMTWCFRCRSQSA